MGPHEGLWWHATCCRGGVLVDFLAAHTHHLIGQILVLVVHFFALRVWYDWRGDARNIIVQQLELVVLLLEGRLLLWAYLLETSCRRMLTTSVIIVVVGLRVGCQGLVLVVV